ncbi:MAG TPA: hypothetical protein VGB99_03900 [Acidobacteriota bacterium]
MKAERMTRSLACACAVVLPLTLAGCGRSGILAPGAPEPATIQFDLQLESAAKPDLARWELEWEGSWETTIGATVEGEVYIHETQSFQRSELPPGQVPYLIWPASQGLQTGAWTFTIGLRGYDGTDNPLGPLMNIPGCNVELLAGKTTIVHLLESFTECTGNWTWLAQPETPNMP